MTNHADMIDINPEIDIIDINKEMFELTITDIEDVSGGGQFGWVAVDGIFVHLYLNSDS